MTHRWHIFVACASGAGAAGTASCCYHKHLLWEYSPTTLPTWSSPSANRFVENGLTTTWWAGGPSGDHFGNPHGGGWDLLSEVKPHSTLCGRIKSDAVHGRNI
jgi:hypothetical protein